MAFGDRLEVQTANDEFTTTLATPTFATTPGPQDLFSVFHFTGDSTSVTPSGFSRDTSLLNIPATDDGAIYSRLGVNSATVSSALDARHMLVAALYEGPFEQSPLDLSEVTGPTTGPPIVLPVSASSTSQASQLLLIAMTLNANALFDTNFTRQGTALPTSAPAEVQRSSTNDKHLAAAEQVLTTTGTVGVTSNYTFQWVDPEAVLGIATYIEDVGGPIVTVLVNVKDKDGVPIESARVLLWASDGTGPFPFQESVTIVNSGTTATVDHTTHGLVTGDKVLIEGASLQENNCVAAITVTDPDTYTYTLSSAPGSNPTGSITSTFVALDGLTDVNGDVSTTRQYSALQPVIGRLRRSTTSPLFRTLNISGEVVRGVGLSINSIMVSDE